MDIRVALCRDGLSLVFLDRRYGIVVIQEASHDHADLSGEVVVVVTIPLPGGLPAFLHPSLDGVVVRASPAAQILVVSAGSFFLGTYRRPLAGFLLDGTCA
ncbi:unnamed protein product [Microthlaspi erraticum]|uniref:Uncharacterized protein n=1 Tax=Microthlaspi erraticum TaxID=1685480 RepID=A0A6D2IY30_9BRAS|nr:unnamed protein product [Microthlaspi erraticum]